MDRETNVDSIRALEEQIKEHEKAIIKLKRTRNSLLNVSTFPPEVLGNIFRWNVALRDDFGGLEEESHNFLLVCHHWFEVASHTPELWTFWGTSLEDWEKRYLRSSPGAPLDLVLEEAPYMSGTVSKPQQMVLKDRASRDTIRRVHLYSDMSSLLTSIISTLLSSCGGLRANALESFILYNEEGAAPLDVSFFAHSRLSKLRRLKLTGCTISSWDHITPQTTLLTSLELFFDDVTPTPTMPQLLSILVSNPHLQKLTLNPRAIPDGDGDGDGSYQVPLPCLEELRLDGAPGQVFELLRRLEYPQKMGTLLLNLFPCVVADISQTIGPYLRDYLRRRGRSRNGLGLLLSLSSGTFITVKVGDVGRFHPSSSVSSRMTSFVSIAVGLEALPEDGLDKLTLDLILHAPREEIVYFQTCRSLEVLKDLRVQMPNLKALDLHRVPLSVFPTLDHDGSLARGIFPPSLQHLFLERPHLNIYGWNPLITFLSHRLSSGNQLDSLRICGPCHVCCGVVQRLEGVVGTVKIDRECRSLESWCPFGHCL
jgi:hypothetical protein